MENENPEANRYLTELCSMTKGDTTVQVSMFDVGVAIGLEKTEAGMVAEELIIEGLAELKSLSGGVGITPQGVALVQGTRGSSAIVESGLQLGSGEVLGDQGRQALDKILSEIRGSVISNKTTFGQLEEVIVDIKTIETQMLSPHPKIAILREVLRSLHRALEKLKAGSLAELVNALIRS